MARTVGVLQSPRGELKTAVVRAVAVVWGAGSEAGGVGGWIRCGRRGGRSNQGNRRQAVVMIKFTPDSEN